jgi:DNA-damage-inducible protein J
MSSNTVPTQIRIDADLKREANALFKDLGLDMSTAVNMFLKQCVIYEGLPLRIEKKRYSRELLAAIEEAEALSRNPNTKKYDDLGEMWADLEDESEDE